MKNIALLTANLFCSNVVASELDTATNLDMQQITYELETCLENYYESVTEAEKDAVQSVIDDYLEKVLPYYQVPYETAFLYRIYMENDSNYEIYECIFDGEDRTVCGEIQQNDVHTDMLTSQDGMEYVNDKLSAANSARGAISLSGYNGNGGVIPYFLGKGYITTIAEDDVYKGCIMYFNEKSHVAIVTYCDSTTIKYSQHSNVKLNTTYYIYKDPDTEEEEIPNVTFYEFH